MIKKILMIISLIFLLTGVLFFARIREESAVPVGQMAEESENPAEQKDVSEQENRPTEESAHNLPDGGTGASEVPETEVPEPEPEPIYCDPVIDFEELRGENQEIYAWITVPGTKIDYPVLQSEEDNYYLEYNIDHTKGYPGCIYTNKCNVKDFSDSNTVMYGHNMLNGSMFAGLHDFEDADFFEQNDTIVVYTENARFTYRIYIAAAYSDAYLPAFFDMTSGEDTMWFLDTLKEYEDDRKLIREDMEVTEEDCLLTLSTCISNESTKRYLVIGKLVEKAIYYERFYTDL